MASQELIGSSSSSSSNPKPKPQRTNPRGAKRSNRQEAVFGPRVDHSPTGRSQNPNEEENDNDEPLASNQLNNQTAERDEPNNSQPPAPAEQVLDEEFEEEWARMSILTQYIGPPRGTGPGTTEEEEGSSNNLKTELDTLKRDFLTQTDTLDRGQKHLEALDRAVAKRRIPARLQITVQPQVLLKEDPNFQREWAERKLDCELRLIGVLQKHLRERVVGQSQLNVRSLGKDTFVSIRRLASSTEATEAIDQTLQEAEKERKERNEQRAKRKLEAAKSNDRKQNQNKRRKPDNK